MKGTKSYTMGREDKIMGKQWARQLFEKKENPQTTHLRSLRTMKLVRVMGLEPIRQRHTPLKRACLPIPAHSHFNYKS